MSDWTFICATSADAEHLRQQGRNAETWAPGDSPMFQGHKVVVIGGDGHEGRRRMIWAANELDGVVEKLLVYDLPQGCERLDEVDDLGKLVEF